MNLTLDRLSALAAIRSIRCGTAPGVQNGLTSLRRTGIAAPELPEGRKRWSASCIDLSELGLGRDVRINHPVEVAVPSERDRIRSKAFSSILHTAFLPKNAYMDAGNGLRVASPELVFVEMGAVMRPEVQALLGYELTGSFSRSPLDPRSGALAYGIPPATSVEKIERFLSKCDGNAGVAQSRHVIEYVANNAWSPAEAVIAALIALPLEYLGYGMGRLVLNVRQTAADELARAGAHSSRVPDILVPGTCVGINYDSFYHLDLDGVVDAARACALAPTDETAAAALEDARRSVREKVLDDLCRNRELAAQGLVVLPATSEDLYRKGGFDGLMLEVFRTIELLSGRDMAESRRALASRAVCDRRQTLIWSLLAWEQGRSYARKQVEREQRGLQRIKDPQIVEVDMVI